MPWRNPFSMYERLGRKQERKRERERREFAKMLKSQEKNRARQVRKQKATRQPVRNLSVPLQTNPVSLALLVILLLFSGAYLVSNLLKPPAPAGVAEVGTATPTILSGPTSVPRATATPFIVPPTPQIVALAEPTPQHTEEVVKPEARVINGGNLRSEPRISSDTVIAQVCPGDLLDLLEDQGTWTRVQLLETAADCVPERAMVGAEGWLSSTLFEYIDQEAIRSDNPVIDVNGVWKGTLSQSPAGMSDSYHYEIRISQRNRNVSGTSRIEIPGYPEYYGVLQLEGTIQGQLLTFRETQIVDYNAPPDTYWCHKQVRLVVDPAAQEMVMQGDWVAVEEGCDGGQVVVRLQK